MTRGNLNYVGLLRGASAEDFLRLREVDAVKDAFVSSVSHELRTPITSIVGYLEMLQEGLFGELNRGQVDAVRRVAANSSRLLGLIDDLLTLSRVQDEKLTPADRAFDLRGVVRGGHDVVAPAWERRDLTVSLDLPAEPVPFVGDRDMMERMVVNLVGILFEGFDLPPMLKQPWHPPYYQRLCEEHGLEKAQDLLMWNLEVSDRSSLRGVAG